MIHRQPFFTLILVGIAACAAARPATAEYVTYDTTTPITDVKTDWTGANIQLLTFRKFDTSLGTLTKIQLDLDSAMSTIITVTNTSGSTSTSWGNVSTVMQLTVGDNVGMTQPQLGITSAPFSYTLGIGETKTSGTITETERSSNDYTSDSILSYFRGTGAVDLTATTSTTTHIANTGGNTEVSQSTKASLDGSITYYYTTIPEPSTLVLLGTLGAGLLAHAWFRRRRR